MGRGSMRATQNTEPQVTFVPSRCRRRFSGVSSPKSPINLLSRRYRRVTHLSGSRTGLPGLSTDSRFGKPRVPSSPLVDLLFFRHCREIHQSLEALHDYNSTLGVALSRVFGRISKNSAPQVVTTSSQGVHTLGVGLKAP
jgi:hypothetical protein